MKTETILSLILTAIAATAQAGLVPAPDIGPLFVGLDHNKVVFFDEARTIPAIDPSGQVIPPGWVSRYGKLNGGTLFTTDLLTAGPSDSATVSWDFGDSRYRMAFVLVYGGNHEDLYRVRNPDFRTTGAGLVTLEEPITSISFWGTIPGRVAETGSTGAFLALGLIALLFHRHKTT